MLDELKEQYLRLDKDDRFIIAKQHPVGQKDIVNYFILDSNKDSELEDIAASVYGPLAESEYLFKIDSLGINKEIKFSIILDK